MQKQWSNWSGSLSFTPDCIEKPEDEAALAALVRRAAAAGRTVRAIGSGHSSTPILRTDDILVSLDNFQGIESYDGEACTATVRAGTTLEETGRLLLDVGMAMHNLGDVATQTVAGALGTGTHGTGKKMQNLSTMLVGGRMVTAAGEAIDFSVAEDVDFVRAIRVSLGTLGIITAVQLHLLPAYKLRRREWCTDMDGCLANLDRLIATVRNVDFYWYPRSDEVKLRTLDAPGQLPDDIAHAVLVEENTGWAPEVIPKHSNIPRKFDEMEYALPAAAGLPCFLEVRRQVLEKWRKTVGWRLLYRTVAPDDSYLSTAYGRETVTISLHQNASLPFWEYFKAIEPIFRAYGGRPHWAKKHTLHAEELRPLYPEWDRFLETRRRMDPEGVFLSPYLRALLEGA